MYGHRVGTYARKPHMDTVQAIRRSTITPYITSPAGVPMEVAQPRGFSGNIHNTDRIMMGDYGQVGGSDSFAAAYPDSAAAVPAPPLQLRNTPVIPAAVYQQRAQARGNTAIPVAATAAAAAAAAAAPSYQQLQTPYPPVQVSRQVNQNSRAAAAAAARAPPEIQDPRNMTPSVTSVRVSDGGGAARSQVVSSATERVQQLYNLSDNDIQNIMRIIQTESASVFGAAMATPPQPVSAPAPAPAFMAAAAAAESTTKREPLPTIPESSSQVSFSEPVAKPISNRDAPPPISTRPPAQQKLMKMREEMLRSAESETPKNVVTQTETKSE